MNEWKKVSCSLWKIIFNDYFRRLKRIFKCCPEDTTNKTKPNFLLTDLRLLIRRQNRFWCTTSRPNGVRSCLSMCWKHTKGAIDSVSLTFIHSLNHSLCLSSFYVDLYEERKNARARMKGNIINGDGATNANTIPKQMREFKIRHFSQWEKERAREAVLCLRMWLINSGNIRLFYLYSWICMRQCVRVGDVWRKLSQYIRSV